jgi:hypothetical protein
MNNQDQRLKHVIKNQKIFPSDLFLESTYSKLNLNNQQLTSQEKTILLSSQLQKAFILCGLILVMVIIFSGLQLKQAHHNENELNTIDAISYGSHLIL